MNDSELLSKVRQKDKQSFDTLFRAYYKPLCIFAYNILRDKELTGEVVQEYFISLWENPPLVTDTVKAYFYKSIYNRCLNCIEKQKNRKKHEEEFADYQLLEVDEKDDNQMISSQAINAAVHELPEKCRDIFMMCKYNEMSYSQVAQLLKVSPKTIENQMGIALKKLRERLLPFAHKK